MARTWGFEWSEYYFIVKFAVGGDLCGLVYSIWHDHRMVHGNATDVCFQM